MEEVFNNLSDSAKTLAVTLVDIAKKINEKRNARHLCIEICHLIENERSVSIFHATKKIESKQKLFKIYHESLSKDINYTAAQKEIESLTKAISDLKQQVLQRFDNLTDEMLPIFIDEDNNNDCK